MKKINIKWHQSTIVDLAKYLKNNDNQKFNYGFEKIYGDD